MKDDTTAKFILIRNPRVWLGGEQPWRRSVSEPPEQPADGPTHRVVTCRGVTAIVRCSTVLPVTMKYQSFSEIRADSSFSVAHPIHSLHYKPLKEIITWRPGDVQGWRPGAICSLAWQLRCAQRCLNHDRGSSGKSWGWGFLS